MGHNLLKQEKNYEAIQYYNRALGIDPNSIDALHNKDIAGVSTVKTYETKKLDSDYFEEA